MLRFIAGYKILRIKKEAAADFANICREYRYSYLNIEFFEEHADIKVTLRYADKIVSAMRYANIDISVLCERGLPSVLKRYKARYGLFVGAAVGIAFAIVSSFMVWDIRVEGNRRLSEREVIEILADCGFRQGDFHGKTDTDILENRVMIYSDDISWISVNIMGTVAEVEIRESSVRDDGEEMSAANLVAVREGVIEYLEDVRGNVSVEVGEAVSRGQLLVGGVYGSENEGFRYTVAHGKVYARTERDFSVNVSFKYQKKVYTGRTKTEKYLIFFKNEVKFYGNSGNLYATCDTIDTVEYFTAVGDAELPFGIRTVKYFEYEYIEAELSEQEAADIAFYSLRQQTEAKLSDAELLSKKVSFEMTDEAYVLNWHMSVIENIAKTEEIEVEVFSAKNKK